MFLRLLSLLPLRILYALAYPCYLTVYYLLRYRTAVTRINLFHAFPDYPMRKRLHIEKRFYRTFINSLFETIKCASMDRSELARRVTFVNFDLINARLEKQQPVILMIAHLGNLEWLLMSASHQTEYHIDPVYRPAHNDRINQFIFDIRSRSGSTPIPYKMLAKDLRLRKGMIRAIAIPSDLRPRRRERTVTVNFLNQSTRFFSAIARVAKRFELPVIFVSMQRTRLGYYQAEAHLLAEHEKDYDENKMIARYAKLVEGEIIRQPESWLWSHARWKH